MNAKEYYIKELRAQGVPEDEIQESLKGDMVQTTLAFAEKYATHRLSNQTYADLYGQGVLSENKIIRLPVRLIREGTIGDCPECGSTTIRRFILFGRRIGCINPECPFYHKRYNNAYRKREKLSG